MRGIWFCYTTDKKLGALSAVKQCGGRKRRKKAIDVHGIDGLTGGQTLNLKISNLIYCAWALSDHHFLRKFRLLQGLRVAELEAK